MNHKADIQLHIIEENGNKLIGNKYVCHVPRPCDEVRMGGEGNEKIYTVTRVVWVYDEPECPFDRVNIGVIEAA